MVRIAGGRAFQMSGPQTAKARRPTELSPGSSNDGSSGGSGTKSPLSADGVELDEVGQIRRAPHHTSV